MASARQRLYDHLTPQHPLSDVAARRCAELHSRRPQTAIGGVACGECWEWVIRDDERVVVEFGLPRGLDRDGSSLVDEVAVERACRGDRVRLSVVERRVAVVLLAGRGLTRNQIMRRLHVGWSAVDVAYPVPGGEEAA